MYLTKMGLYKRIEKCRNELNERGVTNITIENIVAVYDDIVVEYYPFATKGLKGMLFLASDDCDNNGMIINSNLPEEERHFHSIHEFMHIMLHAGIPGNHIMTLENEIRNNQNSFLEWQANEGAAELIIPYKEFVPLFAELFTDYIQNGQWWEIVYGQKSIAEYLAERYQVSVPVILNRISSLSYEIDQFRSGVPIDEVRILSHSKQQEMEIEVTDYRDIVKREIKRRLLSQVFEWDSVIS